MDPGEFRLGAGPRTLREVRDGPDDAPEEPPRIAIPGVLELPGVQELPRSPEGRLRREGEGLRGHLGGMTPPSPRPAAAKVGLE